MTSVRTAVDDDGGRKATVGWQHAPRKRRMVAARILVGSSKREIRRLMMGIYRWVGQAGCDSCCDG